MEESEVNVDIVYGRSSFGGLSDDDVGSLTHLALHCSISRCGVPTRRGRSQLGVTKFELSVLFNRFRLSRIEPLGLQGELAASRRTVGDGRRGDGGWGARGGGSKLHRSNTGGA